MLIFQEKVAFVRSFGPSSSGPCLLIVCFGFWGPSLCFFLWLFLTAGVLSSWMRTCSPPTSRCWICSARRFPKIFCRFVLWFDSCGVCFLWVGGVPLAVFSSWFLGGRGGRFGFSVASCTLASFSVGLGKHGLLARKPPGPCCCFSWPVPPYPSLAGSPWRHGPMERATG